MTSYLLNSINIAPPTGSITAYLGATDPPGWVICDGQLRTASDSRYSNLVALNSLIGGSGTDNSYTPPDYRAAFIRGSNLGTSSVANTTYSSVNYGANAPSLGSKQMHSTEAHTHSASAGIQSANHSHSSVTTNIQSANHAHNVTTSNSQSANHTHTGNTGTGVGGHYHTYLDRLSYFGGGGSQVGYGPTDNDNKFVGRGTATGQISTGHTHSFTTPANTTTHVHTATTSDNSADHTHSYTTDGIDQNHTHTITVNNSTVNPSNTETRPYNFGVNWILKL